MELRLDVSTQAGVAVVRSQGRTVFGQEVDELRLTVRSLLKETNRVVLHLAGITQIDSEGLAALVGLFISSRNRRGEVRFAELSKKSKEILRPPLMKIASQLSGGSSDPAWLPSSIVTFPITSKLARLAGFLICHGTSG